MARPHTHPCSQCQSPAECHGELERNYDGWPEVICSAIHSERWQEVQPVLCDACAESLELERDAAGIS